MKLTKQMLFEMIEEGLLDYAKQEPYPYKIAMERDGATFYTIQYEFMAQKDDESPTFKYNVELELDLESPLGEPSWHVNFIAEGGDRTNVLSSTAQDDGRVTKTIIAIIFDFAFEKRPKLRPKYAAIEKFSASAAAEKQSEIVPGGRNRRLILYKRLLKNFGAQNISIDGSDIEWEIPAGLVKLGTLLTSDDLSNVEQGVELAISMGYDVELQRASSGFRKKQYDIFTSNKALYSAVTSLGNHISAGPVDPQNRLFVITIEVES